MTDTLHGYHGVLLDVNLSSGEIKRISLPPEDAHGFLGGRGLGVKLLWDRISQPGLDPLSPKNPLMVMPGPFCGFPIPSASRTCFVTKSPTTSPISSKYPHASTITYSNFGGFLGPEIRFAGYDGIVITGRAASPVYLVIDDEKVEIRDAGKYWGMKTDAFDRAIMKELGDRRFETCYIGPAGENGVRYSAILHTSARGAGRGGAGCVMGSKHLKAIAVKGSQTPPVADHKRFLTALEDVRASFKKYSGLANWRRYGTASALISSSDNGTQAVKNYREGTFRDIDKIGGVAAEQTLWVRDTACFCCPLACHKTGAVRSGPYAGTTHDGPEYETGTMLGANLLIGDMGGLMRAIADVDNLGLDQISAGNVLGFLMEAHEKGHIDTKFLDGIDLKWGDIDSALKMLDKIAYRDGVGDLASRGVRALSEAIGADSKSFAIHSKGQEYAAWNAHTRKTQVLCYVSCNRGACHLNGHNPRSQNQYAALDSTGYCRFATGGFGKNGITELLSAITGSEWTEEDYLLTGERIYNLEKCFNYREGFRRRDDQIPDRFFTEPLTEGPKKGAALDREEFVRMMTGYYQERDWDPQTTKPNADKLLTLGLDFAARKI